MSNKQPQDNLRVLLCSHIFNRERDINLISRPDGDWCFLCGEDDHAESSDEYKVVGFKHVLEDYPIVSKFLDLPKNWEAEKSPLTGIWTRMPIAPY